MKSQPNAIGILQADCYNGFNPLFDRTKKQTPVTPAFWFAHTRRKFFELADVSRNARWGKRARILSLPDGERGRGAPDAGAIVESPVSTFVYQLYLHGFITTDGRSIMTPRPLENEHKRDLSSKIIADRLRWRRNDIV